MAELADALASGASGGNFVQVQLLLSAPFKKDFIIYNGVFFVLSFILCRKTSFMDPVKQEKQRSLLELMEGPLLFFNSI